MITRDNATHTVAERSCLRLRNSVCSVPEHVEEILLMGSLRVRGKLIAGQPFQVPSAAGGGTVGRAVQPWVQLPHNSISLSESPAESSSLYRPLLSLQPRARSRQTITILALFIPELLKCSAGDLISHGLALST